MAIEIDPRLPARLRDHALARQPREACGLLARDPTGRVVHYAPLRNVAAHPRRFAMDPIEVARVEARFRSDGLALAGVFHSHPEGPARPSAADEAAAWPDLVQWIAALGAGAHDRAASEGGSDGAGFELTAWRHRAGRLEPVAWRIATSACGGAA